MRNAIEHGAKTDPISVIGRDNGAEVLVEVHNGGPCIPQAAMASLFEPMVRHAENQHKSSGLGLGLYIASQIVVAHGGRFDVTSTEAGGTTFAVHLPRRIPARTRSARPPALSHVEPAGVVETSPQERAVEGE